MLRKLLFRAALLFEDLSAVLCVGNVVWELASANQTDDKTGTDDKGQDEAVDGVPSRSPTLATDDCGIVVSGSLS